MNRLPLIFLFFFSCVFLWKGVDSKNCDHVAQENRTRCCDKDKPKPLSCLFRSIEEQATDEKCGCVPRKSSTDSETAEICQWNTPYPTDLSRTVGCQGFTSKCKDPAENLRFEIVCPIAREGNYLYPPRGPGLKFEKNLYCKLRNVETDGHFENFYDVMLTCWLYECDIRLTIPKKTLEMERQNKDFYRWCFPPRLHEGSPLKYCGLYERQNSVFTGLTDEGFVSENKTNDPCILPPLCGSDGKVDISRSMIPLNNGEVNEKYCEILCPVNRNIYEKGKECRVRPSCKEGSNSVPDPKYNKYMVMDVTDGPSCLPWCSDNDSRLKDREKRTSVCNNKPICKTVDGDPNLLNSTEHYLPYGEYNQYGAEKCLPILPCEGKQTADTHFCYLEGHAPTEPPIGVTVLTTTEGTSLPVSANVGIVVCIIGLLVIVLIIGGVFLWRRKKTKRFPDEFTENNLAQGGEAAVNDSPARPAKSSKRRKKTSKSATAITPTSPATKPGGQTPSEGLYEDYSPTGKQGDQVPIATPSTDKV